MAEVERLKQQLSSRDREADRHTVQLAELRAELAEERKVRSAADERAGHAEQRAMGHGQKDAEIDSLRQQLAQAQSAASKQQAKVAGLEAALEQRDAQLAELRARQKDGAAADTGRADTQVARVTRVPARCLGSRATGVHLPLRRSYSRCGRRCSAPRPS